MWTKRTDVSDTSTGLIWRGSFPTTAWTWNTTWLSRARVGGSESRIPGDCPQECRDLSPHPNPAQLARKSIRPLAPGLRQPLVYRARGIGKPHASGGPLSPAGLSKVLTQRGLSHCLVGGSLGSTVRIFWGGSVVAGMPVRAKTVAAGGPVAYLVAFRCYGHRLHGGPLAAVDPSLAAENPPPGKDRNRKHPPTG